MDRARHASDGPISQESIEEFNNSLVMPIAGITRDSDRLDDDEGDSFDAFAAMMGA